jgi:hypothetical protein
LTPDLLELLPESLRVEPRWRTTANLPIQ